MRIKLPFLLSLCLLALPGAAHAATEVAIAENQPSFLTNPLFTELQNRGVNKVRVIVSYNVMTKGDDELARVRQYLNTAQALGLNPLVQLEHARGDATICNKRSNFNKPVCKLPSIEEYQLNLQLFLREFPSVKLLGPWNEINHFTQGTARNAKRAAQFTKVARRLCPTCTILEADILDQADKASARKLTFKSLNRYAKAWLKAYGKRPKLCGIHNYSSVNRYRDDGTKAIMKAFKCKKYWWTETGGLYKFGSFKPDEDRQLKATKYMFKIAKKHKVSTLFVYSFQGNPLDRFDAGLVDVRTNTPRKAYEYVKAKA